MKTSLMFVTGSLDVRTPVPELQVKTPARGLKVKTYVRAGQGGLAGGGPGPIGPGG